MTLMTLCPLSTVYARTRTHTRAYTPDMYGSVISVISATPMARNTTTIITKGHDMSEGAGMRYVRLNITTLFDRLPLERYAGDIISPY